MYLTNDERIRLGLLHMGSDVPQEVVAEAEKQWWAANPVGDPPVALQEAPAASDGPVAAIAPEEPVEAAAAPRRGRRRARDTEGRFEGDNPTTQAVNEAYEGA